MRSDGRMVRPRSMFEPGIWIDAGDAACRAL
jgi:hypothetical protein